MQGLAGALTGIVLGFVIQRGRFDMGASFHAFQIRRETEPIQAWGLAVIVQASLLFLLTRLGGMKLPVFEFYWLAAVAGGMVFGAGTALAGSGVASVWSRAGQGMVDAFVTVIGLAIGGAAASTGLAAGLVESLQRVRTDQVTTIHGLFGVSFGNALSYALLLGLWWFTLSYKRQCVCKVPPVRTTDLRNLFPGLVGKKLTPEFIYHLVFRRPWSWMATGITVGLAATLAWFAGSKGGGLEVTSGTVSLLQGLVSRSPFQPWSVCLVLGIAGGAALASSISGERWLSGTTPRSLLNSLTGGALMGLGAVTALGDDIAAGLTGTAIFSLQGVTTTVAIFVGAWLTHLVWGELRVIRIPGEEIATK